MKIVMFSNPLKNIDQFNVDPGHIVADFGSGSGHYTIALSKKIGNSGKVYALDIQKDLLEKLKKTSEGLGLSNINVIWADLDEERGSGLADEIIDRVVATNILFQVEKKDNLVKEIHRVLKTKGRVLLIDWSESFSGIGPQAQDVVKQDVARVLFESHGFVLEKEIQAGDHHYGLIFRKS
jgi:ubiquinone/menaquinone biosynthesis C-methylase UbiE